MAVIWISSGVNQVDPEPSRTAMNDQSALRTVKRTNSDNHCTQLNTTTFWREPDKLIAKELPRQPLIRKNRPRLALGVHNPERLNIFSDSWLRGTQRPPLRSLGQSILHLSRQEIWGANVLEATFDGPDRCGVGSDKL